MTLCEKKQALSKAEKLTGVGHWSIELPENTIFWSEQTYIIHGENPKTYTPSLEDAINFYHPDDRQDVINYVDSSIKLGKDFEFSLRLLRKDNSIRHVNAKATCEHNEQGDVIRVFGIFQDVTKEIIQRTLFNRTCIAHQSLIESSNDGYWDWYIQEDYEYMSTRFWEMFGYLPEEKPHHPSAWQDMIFKEDLELSLKNHQQHIDSKGEHPYHQEARYRHKNGSTVTVLCRGKVVEWDEHNQPIRMIGTHTDITEFKRSEMDVRNSLDFQRLLIDANTDLVLVKNAHFKVIDANSAYLTLHPNKTLEDIIGTSMSDYYSPAKALTFLQSDKKALKEGFCEETETILFTDGKEHVFLTKKMRFYDRIGKPHILCVGRDITGMRKVEQKLIEANNELEEFAYRTSHDLRSPLVSSKRLLSIIHKLISNGEIKKALTNLDLVGGSLGKLEVLVTDILNMARLNNEDLSMDSVDFSQLFLQCSEKISHMDGFSKLTITTDFSNAPNVLNTSKLHIQHILENLLSNAVKYQDPNNEKPHIHLLVNTTKDSFKFSVSDNGLGIPKDKAHNLFTMFKRLHAKTSFGSGLGLYMVKKSVERLHGRIECTPLDTGTCFTVNIPLNLQ